MTATDVQSPPSPPGLVSIRKLTKAYDGKVALDRLDLEIRAGDIFGYIGPNGAGKTTTLRILAALLLPTSGSAQIDGVDVVKEPRRIKELVGYMPDSFGVYENMTLREYLDFFAAAYRIGKGKRAQVIRDVLDLTDLGSKQNDQVSVFSRGMKQRACLAKTLLHDPKVLILDEPTSGLDPRARIEFRELLRELQRMGKTVIVSSHILMELSSFCSTVGFLETGKLLVAGEVGEILRSIRTRRRFTLDLLDGADSPRAEALLGKWTGVSEVEPAGPAIRFDLDATDPDVAGLVEGLVAKRIRFTGFREEQVDLETAFLAITRGKLA